DSSMDIPNSLNEKTKLARGEGDSDKNHPNHRSAYYYTIYGGEPGKDYTANLIIAPPRLFRGNGETFEGFNLDYFLLTSELASLEDKSYITDVIIGTSPNVYDDITPEVVLDSLGNVVENIDYTGGPIDRRPGEGEDFEAKMAEDPYGYYSLNTIGYIEQEIKSESNGKFDTIRPYFTNGVPDYRFVNSEDIEFTKTLSPLYRPIIVSEGRYGQLVKGGYTQSEIIIDLKEAIGNWYYTDERSGVYIAKYLAAGLKPTILLSNKGFRYPIDRITIGGSEINSLDYEVKNGYLYLSPSIPLDNPDTFDLHIYFDTIKYLPTNTPNVNDKFGRLALAQTLSYSISDYFSQYYIAAINAKRKAELEFTVQTTVMSTLLSTLILAPVAISASVIRSGASIGHAVVSQLARIPSAVMEETFEELYLDPLIENFIKTHADL
ncbi:hypothetical protein LCGC14_2704650, partial [marine sediment metagenome]